MTKLLWKIQADCKINKTYAQDPPLPLLEIYVQMQYN